MTEKIEWYKEVLELEPGSKLFFPLAKMLTAEGRLEEACDTLAAGLARNGEFFEARLLQVDVLSRLGRTAECELCLRELESLLSRYEEFWRAWSTSLEGRGEAGSAVTLRLMRAILGGHDIDFTDLLRRGLESLDGDATRAPHAAHLPEPRQRLLSSVDDTSTASPQSTERPAAPRLSDPEEDTAGGPRRPAAVVMPVGRTSLRTCSMAEVLAEQGDIPAALDIYGELLAAATDDAARADLERRIAALGGGMDWPRPDPEIVNAPFASFEDTEEATPEDGAAEPAARSTDPVVRPASQPAEPAPAGGDNAALISLLSRLAERVEARAQG